MPDNLDTLFEKYKKARLSYLNVRRDAEEALMTELVARVKALGEPKEAKPGDWLPSAVPFMEFRQVNVPNQQAVVTEPPKRKPGRPPKEAA